MKKTMIGGLALAVAILTMGVGAASAADSCCNDGKCHDIQALQQFNRDTANLTSALEVKDLELRQQFGYDSFDTQKVDRLENELKEMKGKIRHAAQKYNIPPCCIS